MNALIALCNRMSSADGPLIKRELQATLPPLPEEVELVLYRVAQESITNAIRHSNADTISLSLEGDTDFVTLRVRDDGDGMPRQLPSGTSGISGMRERALLVGGRFSIESVPTRGTEVRLMIPLEGERT